MDALLSESGYDNFQFTRNQPKDKYQFDERSVNITIHEGSSPRVVNFTETDLSLYETVINESGVSFNELLNQRYKLKEHPLITAQRIKMGLNHFNLGLENDNALLALAGINNIPASELTKFDQDTILKLLKLVSNSPEAISQIWDPDNGRFDITANTIPDWVRRDIPKYKEARYNLESVPSKVDTVLLGKMIQNVTSKDMFTGLSIETHLRKILTSDNYLSSHAIQTPDGLFDSYISMVVSENFPESLRKHSINKLVTELNTDRHNQLWIDLATRNPALLKQLSKLDFVKVGDKNRIEMIIEAKNLDKPREHRMQIESIDDNELKVDLQKQKEQYNGVAYINLASVIGDETITTQLSENGVKRLDTDASVRIHEKTIMPHRTIFFPGRMDTQTVLFTDQETNLLGDLVDAPKTEVNLFVDSTVDTLKSLITNPDIFNDSNVKFRIILGRYVGFAGRELQYKLTNLITGMIGDQIGDKVIGKADIRNIANRIVLCEFQGNDGFVDSSFRF